jgi:peroxiredoxin family protein
MKMQNVQEKMQAISAAQNAFATIESIRPGAIPQETKVLLAELKVDLMDIQDAQEEQNSSGMFGEMDNLVENFFQNNAFKG